MKVAIWCFPKFSIGFLKYKSVNSFWKCMKVLDLWYVDLSRLNYTPRLPFQVRVSYKCFRLELGTKETSAVLKQHIQPKINLAAAVKRLGRHSGNVSFMNCPHVGM